MSIDWFTVAAQIVNFLVLVWLLKKYLYKPVLDAVKKREQKIAGQLADAAAAVSSAKAKEMEYEEKRLSLEQEASALRNKAKTAANDEKEKLLADARKAVETERSGWMEALRQEQEHIDRELAEKTQSAVLDVARKCLEDLAGMDLQERMVAVFIRTIEGMDSKEKEALAAALKSSPEVTVKTALTLPEETRALLLKMITGFRGPGGRAILFEADPGLLCGIGIYMSGYKLEWTMGDYLERIRMEAAKISRQELSGSLSSVKTPLTTG